MATTRSYGDACALARALDVVGERWALLIVRELLFGPQRFSDLRGALANASSNLIADRLRELEGRGVIRRRKLPPPAGSSVYELTDWGRRLEPILLALGQWGAIVPLPSEATLSASSVMLFLRGTVHPQPETSSTVYGLQLDDRMWTVRTVDGEIDVQYGEADDADVVLRTDPQMLNALLNEPHALDAALADATVIVEGDVSALRELLRAALGQLPLPKAASTIACAAGP
ncbi:MAG: helix-turn-helix transcriptional regulator [Actinomycetota bacterium]|nr:helix-turn-helix transcriptional regulator [Actinomycetota bacterium]